MSATDTVLKENFKVLTVKLATGTISIENVFSVEIGLVTTAIFSGLKLGR
jgi:hypothetical protein